jgi:eukaryotic-like serine/threonine-protein kinase
MTPVETGTIGRFAVRSRLGAGGFATVWLAHDPELDAPVAVKVLADNWAGQADIRRRFVDEARLLRRVDSDHVVRVYDIGSTAAGQPYFVMTYADRGCLEDRLEQSPPPWPADQVAAMVDALAAGLEVLHRHGIVHRDVKPRNILLRARTGTGGGVTSESVLLGDLGVAKDLTWASGLTMPVGTVGYHAPEQAGYSEQVGPASDVYSMAVVAGRLLGLTGPPWPGDPVGAVLAAATQADPALRTGRATDFAEQLRQALDRSSDTVRLPPPEATVVAPPTTAPPTTVAWPGQVAAVPAPAKPRRGRRWPAVMAAVVLLGGAGSLWALTHREQRFHAGRVTEQLPAGWTASGTVTVPGEKTGDGLRAVGSNGRRVEVALAGTSATPATVAGRTRHPECSAAAAASVKVRSLAGIAVRWKGCPGGSTVDEVGLADPARPGEVVWMRVVSVSGDPGLATALAGLTIGS